MNFNNMKEIKNEIDRIDRQIVKLIGQRSKMTKEASGYNTDFRISEMITTMLRERRLWAYEENVNPDIITELYKKLIAHFANMGFYEKVNK
ncbi:MAG: chorismate mutase [Endomicrobiales bacterium]|nr:chorismate mutase [Endomicrobiales bacterium]